MEAQEGTLDRLGNPRFSDVPLKAGLPSSTGKLQFPRPPSWSRAAFR